MWGFMLFLLISGQIFTTMDLCRHILQVSSSVRLLKSLINCCFYSGLGFGDSFAISYIATVVCYFSAFIYLYVSLSVVLKAAMWWQPAEGFIYFQSHREKMTGVNHSLLTQRKIQFSLERRESIYLGWESDTMQFRSWILWGFSSPFLFQT